MFRTRLKWAVDNQKPNFAGHYILTTWGCGTSCIMGAVINSKTGKVSWWNFSVCCWSGEADENFQPIEFRNNSKLIFTLEFGKKTETTAHIITKLKMDALCIYSLFLLRNDINLEFCK